MHKYTCVICECEFLRDWEDPKRVKPKYCSLKCYGNARIRRHETLLGKTFGKLKVLAICEERSKRGQALIKCLCECGKIKDIPAHHIEEGKLISCGCWKSGKERALPTFMKKIEKTSGCWNWKGQISKAGYGRHCCKYAHRLSYQYYKGEIPKGLMICHTCNNKACVNPEHMYLGTAYDNAQDAIRDGIYKKRSLTSKRWIK